MRAPIVIVDYDPIWKTNFQRLYKHLYATVGDSALSIEHVGSTSVEGLAAKPIIDIDIIVEDEKRKKEVIAKLDTIGYRHLGDLGVIGREAFRREGTAPEDKIEHHLYVCTQGVPSLKNHLALRDHLRQTPAAVLAYGNLKKELAAKYSLDILSYIDGKTDFIINILKTSGFSEREIQEARNPNLKANNK